MSRRSAGTGSVTKAASGRWRVRYVVDGERKTFGTYETRDEADTVARSIGQTATRAGRGGLTLATWAARVLDRRELAGLRSVRSERYRWKAYFATWEGAAMPLDAISKRDVKAWLRKLRVADQTKRNALNLLRAIFHEAVEDELLSANPCADMRVRSTGNTEATSTFLTLDELVRLLWSADEGERAVVAFAAGTGLRQGEMRSLLLRDVKLDGASPHVVVRFGAPGKPTKSGAIRTVPLFGLAFAALRAHVAALSGPNPRGLAFPTPRGHVRPIGRMVLPATWATWLRRAGIRRTVRWHDLRHTCATLLLQGAWGRPWTLEECKEMLGHSAVRVTERYAKATGSLAERAAAELRTREGHGQPRDAIARWEPTAGNHSERRGSDSNRRMTVLQAHGTSRDSARIHELASLARALREKAAAYGSALASQAPHANMRGMELMAAALDAADALDGTSAKVVTG